VSGWKTNDPLWKGTKGKGIIGALNYLASEEVNSIYFITMNIAGDGDDVWPYVSPIDSDYSRFDVSKLDQWEIVFSHADSLGIMLQFVTQERENQMLLDNGNVGNKRKLYYRELIARFGHHLAITWNMGEENGWDYQGRGVQNDQQRKDMATYFKTHDPYKNFVVIHNYTDSLDITYQPLLGYPDYDGTSIQMANNDVHGFTQKWVDSSAAHGKNWVVNHDETVGGVDPNGSGNNQGMMRELVLWANYMAGGGGVEWYFGLDDLEAENFSTRSGMWRYTRQARHFFETYLPFWKMRGNDNITTSTTDYVFELPGSIYAVYSRFGSSTNITLPSGTYTVKWYDPTNGGALKDGSVTTVQGGGSAYLGNPPYANNDWAILITNNFSASFSVTDAGCDQQGGAATVNLSGGIPPFTYRWSNGDSTATISNVAPGAYQVTVTDYAGSSVTAGVTINLSATATVHLKVFLEGPYDQATGLMKDNLRAAGLIPLTEPFTALGFTHRFPGGGETTTSAVLNVTGNNAIVDWVLVELRDKNNRTNVLATRSALLQRDGDIVDVNGTLPLVFNGIPCDNYFIAVRHRNHLGFVTMNAQALSALTLDLSSSSVSLYGSNPQKNISGKRVMWAGNCNRDNVIKYLTAGNDKDLILSRIGGIIPTSVVSGYYAEDANLDGIVKYMGLNNDRDIILVNIGGSNPSATRMEQLP